MTKAEKKNKEGEKKIGRNQRERGLRMGESSETIEEKGRKEGRRE